VRLEFCRQFRSGYRRSSSRRQQWRHWRDGGLPWRMRPICACSAPPMGKPVIMAAHLQLAEAAAAGPRQHRDNQASRDAAGRVPGGEDRGGCAHRPRLRPCAGGIGDMVIAERKFLLLCWSSRTYLSERASMRRRTATHYSTLTLGLAEAPDADRSRSTRRSQAALIVLERRGRHKHSADALNRRPFLPLSSVRFAWAGSGYTCRLSRRCRPGLTRPPSRPIGREKTTSSKGRRECLDNQSGGGWKSGGGGAAWVKGPGDRWGYNTSTDWKSFKPGAKTG